MGRNLATCFSGMRLAHRALISTLYILSEGHVNQPLADMAESGSYVLQIWQVTDRIPDVYSGAAIMQRSLAASLTWQDIFQSTLNVPTYNIM